MNFSHSQMLSLLTQSAATEIKAFAESLLPHLEQGLTVQQNRTGLVMLPYRDTVQGTLFHLGEVLVAEAQLERQGIIGYGAVLGRDLEQAMAVAVVDLAWQAGIETAQVEQFLESAQAAQLESDKVLMKKVEATRVNMETF